MYKKSKAHTTLYTKQSKLSWKYRNDLWILATHGRGLTLHKSGGSGVCKCFAVLDAHLPSWRGLAWATHLKASGNSSCFCWYTCIAKCKYYRPREKAWVYCRGVTKGCRLPWLTTSALVCEPKCVGRCGVSANEYCCTVIRFVWASAKFGTCTFVSVNGTLVEAKMCTFTLESTHFIFNKCPIFTLTTGKCQI